MAADTRALLPAEVQHGDMQQVYEPSTNGATAPDYDPNSAQWSNTQSNVLLVDDEPVVRALAGRVLRGAGYAVLEAGDGIEGVRLSELHRTQTIHLLITDVVMPAMNGKELANQLFVTRPTTRVIYMSGYADNVLKYFDVLSSGWAFIPNPFTPRQLLDTAKRVHSA